MKKLLILIILICITGMCACSPPDVQIEYKEENKMGSLVKIGENFTHEFGYRVTGKFDNEPLTPENADKIKTEICMSRKGQTDVMFTLKGEHTVSIVETSGLSGDNIYFQATQNDIEYSILFFNQKTGLTKRLINHPSSKLIVVPSITQYAYTLHGSVITAISLDQGSIDENESYAMENSTMFFYSESSEYYKKSSQAELLDDTTFKITIGTYYTKDSKIPESTVIYHYDATKKIVWGPY